MRKRVEIEYELNTAALVSSPWLSGVWLPCKVHRINAEGQYYVSCAARDKKFPPFYTPARYVREKENRA